MSDAVRAAYVRYVHYGHLAMGIWLRGSTRNLWGVARNEKATLMLIRRIRLGECALLLALYAGKLLW